MRHEYQTVKDIQNGDGSIVAIQREHERVGVVVATYDDGSVGVFVQGTHGWDFTTDSASDAVDAACGFYV